MTYQQAYDKIIQAYFRDEIQPMMSNFCFCGTLADGGWWREGDTSYSNLEYCKMESALLSICGKSDRWVPKLMKNIDYPGYEDDLFKGMTAALEVLKQIHRERGEDVDSLPALTKRNLQTVI